MSEYNFITNPLTGRKVNINGKIGQHVLANYKRFSQTGGHDGPCALNSKGNRCKKSDTWDNERCELSVKRNCIKKKYPKKAKKDKKVQKKIVVKVDNKYSDIKLDDDELLELVTNFSPPGFNSIEKAVKVIKKIRYDPEYISMFTGEHITIKSVAEHYYEMDSFRETMEDLCNDKYIKIEALKDQIMDQMGEETFWSDIANQ